MTYRPATRTPTADRDLLHSSTRTTLSTNADIARNSPAHVTLRVTKLDIRWDADGDIGVRFSAQAVDVTPQKREQRRFGR